MAKERSFLQKLSDETDVIWPGVTLIELVEDSRILIENHFGVAEYSPVRMRINTTYGQVIIYGRCLDLQRMTKDQLVIRGTVNCIKTVRGNGNE